MSMSLVGRALPLILLIVLLTSRAATSATVSGTTNLLEMRRADISFTMALEPDEVASLFSTEEEKLREYVCRSLFKDYALSFCFVSFEHEKLYVHVFIDDISRFIVLKDLAPTGEVSFHVSYTPLYLDLFENIGITWEENVLIPPAQRFRKSGVSGQGVTLNVGVFADIQGISFNPMLSTPAATQRSAVGLEFNIDEATEVKPTLCLTYVRRGRAVYFTQVSPNCAPTYVHVGPWPVASDYTIETFAVSVEETLHVAHKSFTFAVTTPPQQFISFQTTVSRPSRIVYRGETTTARLQSRKLDASCTVRLVDARGEAVFDSAVGCDAEVPVDTTQLDDGTYVFKAEGVSGPERNSLSRVFQVITSKTRELEGNFTAKREFMAGETISITLSHLSNAMCYATLLDAVGSMVAAHNEPQQCAGFFLEVPAGARRGEYTLRIRVVQGGRTVATRSQSVIIHDIEPDNRLFGICQNGQFIVGPDLAMPCLNEGMRCRPGPDELPSCLCANRREVFVCKMEALCTEDGCQGGRDVGFDLTEGGCSIRAGLVSYACAFDGETCAKRTCSCLDDTSNTLDTCAFSQLCTLNGCIEPTLTAKVEGLTPLTVRREDLAEGVTFDLVLKLGYRQVDLSDELTRDLHAQFTVGRERLPKVRPSEYLGSGRWRFRFPIQANPEPGFYRVYIKVFYHGEVWSMARTIEVWYPRHAGDLNGRVVAAPTTFEHTDIHFGIRKHILLRLSDRGNLVTSFPKDAFRAYLGGEEMIVNSAEYDDIRGLWDMLVIFRSPHPEEMGPYAALEVNVSHLGQGINLTAPPVELHEVAPTTIDIVSVEPADYVFQAESVLGFDFTLTLALRGFSNEDFRNLYITITNDYGEGVNTTTIPYDEMNLVNTPQGIQVFVRSVRFCGPVIFLPKLLKVRIAVTGKEFSSAETHLFVRQNPGGYLFDTCEVTSDEGSYGNIIIEERTLDHLSVSVRNTGESMWPPQAQLVLKIAKGFAERPILVQRYDVASIAPNEVRHLTCTLDNALAPGSYAVAVYIEAPVEGRSLVLSSKSVVMNIEE